MHLWIYDWWSGIMYSSPSSFPQKSEYPVYTLLVLQCIHTVRWVPVIPKCSLLQLETYAVLSTCIPMLVEHLITCVTLIVCPLTSGSTHAERLPCSVCLSSLVLKASAINTKLDRHTSLVLIAEAFLFLQCKHTDRNTHTVTDATDNPTHRLTGKRKMRGTS